MFLDKKNSVGVKKKKVRLSQPEERLGRSQKQRKLAARPKKPYLANQIVKVTVPKSVFSSEAEEAVLKEEIEVRTFVTEPARIGAQWMWSAEEVKEVGKGKLESEWHGFRIYIEVPCYVERLVETQREVIEKVKMEAQVQYREFISRAAKRDFVEKEIQDELGTAMAHPTLIAREL